MTNHDFNRFITELSSYYKHDCFSPGMLGVIWKIVEPLTPYEGEQVIDLVVQHNPRVPTPAQIKQAALPLLGKAWERLRQSKLTVINDGVPCVHCADSGVVFALLRTDPRAEYSFGCPKCKAYEVRKLKHPPVWQDSHREKYIPMSLKPDSFNAVAKLRIDEYEKRRASAPKQKRPEEW